jgi:hypothetical protein
MRINPVDHKIIREVVDGQQRLNSVFQFLNDEFPLLKTHNKELGGQTFSQLHSSVQNDILKYKFLVNTLDDVTDAEVLNIFARLNTYTESLKGQELLNAQWFGEFKQEIYKTSHKYYNFWTEQNILKDRQISRMADATLTSDLYICMIDGLRGTGVKVIGSYYEKFDDNFPGASNFSNSFDSIINEIGNIYGDKLRNSPFRRVPLFFTLFLLIYDTKYGLKNLSNPKIRISAQIRRQVSERLDSLSIILNQKEPSPEYNVFRDYARAATADVGKRKYRHEFMRQYIFEQKDKPTVRISDN